MAKFFIFILGAALGSFFNVVTARYEPERFLLSRKIIGGRSRCPRCGNKLSWFELVPILSFILQRGRCRKCSERLSLQYPIVEILSGLIFVAVPWRFADLFQPNSPFFLATIFWITVFSTLLILSLIDLRLKIIPDEINLFLLFLGIFSVLLMRQEFDATSGSFSGPYALLFGLRTNIWTNHILAGLFAGAAFAALILITSGRGMGVGDLKLAVPLGLIFGWPDIIFIVGIAFVIGSIFGVYSLILKTKTLNSALPFGPFLAAATAIVFFFGHELADFYFRLFIIR